MTEGKLEIKVGNVSFSGEGQDEWLSKQLDKVLARLPELAAIQDRDDDSSEGAALEGSNHKAATQKSGQRPSLAVFLKDRKANTGNQQRKFLATAAWLQKGGANRVSTSDVTKALSDNNQGKLTNAAQCLINLAKPGWVVREGKQFYVSEEGYAELGK
jgi:hypothetical protein